MARRVFDWGLGLSAVGWAVRAVLVGRASDPVGATIAAINLVAGLLFISRRGAASRAPLCDDALCLGSVLMSGVALKLAPQLGAWPRAAALLFVAAGLGAIASLLVLGRSFGVFPAFRGLVTRGPFVFIRHPIYAAELGMVAACALASGTLLGWAPLPLAAGLAVVRIVVEERWLLRERAYRAYAHRVRWRLLPGLW